MAAVDDYFLTGAPYIIDLPPGENPAIENVVLATLRELRFLGLQAHDVQKRAGYEPRR